MKKILSLMAVLLCLFVVPASAYHIYSEEEINDLAGTDGAGSMSCEIGIASKTSTDVNCIKGENGLVITLSEWNIPKSADLFIPFTTDEDLEENDDMGDTRPRVYPYSETETTTESYICGTTFNEQTMEEENILCTQTIVTQKPNEPYYLMSCSRGISKITDEGIFCNR